MRLNTGVPRAQPEILPLTALRGIAAGWVLLLHVRPMLRLNEADWPTLAAFGYLGVDLFFLLSGFILAYVYQSGIGYGRFLALRLARIYPVHLAMLAVVGLYAFGTDHAAYWPERFTLHSLLANLLLVQAWTLDRLTWNLVAWSISAEWFAYLLFPLVVFAWRPASSAARALAGIAGCYALLFAVPPLSPEGNLNVHFGAGALVRVLLEFNMGYGSFQLWRLSRERCAALDWDAVAVAGAVALLFLVTVGAPDLLAIPLFAVLIVALASCRGTVAALLSRPAFRYLGEISYSLYLVHFWVLTVLSLVASRLNLPDAVAVLLFVAISVGLSAAMYHLVERPARSFVKRRLDARRPAPAPAAAEAALRS